MKFIFFSLRDFTQDGGASIRMYGILNTLAAHNHQVVFISNAEVFNKFHPKIQHINIGYKVSPLRKMIFQGLLSILPAILVYRLFASMFIKINAAIKKVDPNPTKIFFFEYLDNSIGFVLKKQDKVTSYINDLHGIATIEFDYLKRSAKSLSTKFFYNFKYLLAQMLDTKTYRASDGIIFASKAMQTYYEKKFGSSESKKIYILPYALGEEACSREVNENLRKDLIYQYDIEADDFVIFFAGGYKPTAGVDDLMRVTRRLIDEYPNRSIKLFLIGGRGPMYKYCRNLAKELSIERQTVFIENIPYEELKTYQSLASVIVNPDRQNEYSDLIVHVKYFDALVSGQVVINGAFQSVREINPHDELSLTFTPSDLESLCKSLENSMLEQENLKLKYKNTKDYVCQHLTYDSMIHVLAEN